MQVHFKGRILPTHWNLTISEIGKVGWKFDYPVAYTVTMQATVQNSQIAVECDVSHVSPAIIRHLRSRATDYVSLAVNLYTFVTGKSLAALLEICILPDGTVSPIALEANDAGRHVTAVNVDENGRLIGFGSSMRAIFNETQAMFALNDLTQCIAHPDVTAMNVGRMLDALRKLVVGSPEANERTWAVFRDRLRVDRAYLDLITNASKDPRHGYRWDLREHERVLLQRRGWAIMNRFIEYRKRGNTLPEAEFSILKG